jgi:hypothetical protein
MCIEEMVSKERSPMTSAMSITSKPRYTSYDQPPSGLGNAFKKRWRIDRNLKRKFPMFENKPTQ